MNALDLRIGLGQDSHRFASNYSAEKPLVLGGITFEDQLSFEANSDGDVVLHCLFNGISSALGLRSIGYYCDPMCLEDGITDSSKYLEVILQKMADMNYTINNLSFSIEAAKPRLEERIPEIVQNIALLCKIEPNQIGITATSGEKLTGPGRGEGIQALCTVCLAANGA